jgi:hypothetical protein
MKRKKKCADYKAVGTGLKRRQGCWPSSNFVASLSRRGDPFLVYANDFSIMTPDRACDDVLCCADGGRRHRLLLPRWLSSGDASFVVYLLRQNVYWYNVWPSATCLLHVVLLGHVREKVVSTFL